jgi:hypothetical protein
MSHLSRYKRYCNHVFLERYAKLIDKVKEGRIPSNLDKCFSELGFNPEYVSEKLYNLIRDGYNDIDARTELVWFLIFVGFQLGKHSKKKHKHKVHILRFPRE